MATETVMYLFFLWFECVVLFELQYTNKSCIKSVKIYFIFKENNLKFISKCSKQLIVLKSNSAAFQSRNIFALQYKNFSFISVLELMKPVNTYSLHN